MDLDRRQFLKRAGLTGGALAAIAALPGCKTLFPPGYNPGSTILDGAAADSPIDTIVIVMSENRSFDHWLGWLGSHQGYVDAGRSQYGKFFTVDANNQAVLSSPNGPVATHHSRTRVRAASAAFRRRTSSPGGPPAAFWDPRTYTFHASFPFARARAVCRQR